MAGIRRIAFFLWGLRGGAFSNLALSLGKGFLENGVEHIDFVVLKGGNSEIGHHCHNFSVIELDCSRTILSAPYIISYILKYNPDIFISLSWINNIPSIISKIILKLSNRWSGKLVITEHANISYKAGVEHRNVAKLRMMPTLMRVMYPKADGLVAVSDDVMRDLVKTISLGSIPMKVIYNPVDIEHIVTMSLHPLDDEWMFNKGDDEYFTVINIGRLAKQKRHDVLIDAVCKIQNNYRANIRLIILGDGPLKMDLLKLIGRHGADQYIQLRGFVENPYAYLHNSDMFVLSSEEEGFGLVLLEAMACGCPIISTDCPGGPAAILDKGKYGVLVQKNDSAELANAILELSANHLKRQHLVALSAERVAQFSPKSKSKEYLDFFETLTTTPS